AADAVVLHPRLGPHGLPQRRDVRRQVAHDVVAGHGVLHGGRVEQVDGRRAGAELLEGGTLGRAAGDGGEIVAGGHQLPHRPPPEHAGRAGDEDLHDVTSCGSSRASTTSTAASARRTTASSPTPPSGCSTTATRASGRPKALATSWASTANGVVATTTVGRPEASSWTRSWTLHDVHEPQSALPVS